MPNVALYARYSSDLQNPQSIEDQFNLCRQFAERQGWKIVGYYRDEAISRTSSRGSVWRGDQDETLATIWMRFLGRGRDEVITLIAADKFFVVF